MPYTEAINTIARILNFQVDHLDNLIKLKDERINELQKQLDRKQLRRKESDGVVPNINSTSILPFEEPPAPIIELMPTKVPGKHSIKQSESHQIDIKQSDNKQVDIKQPDINLFDNKQFDIKPSDNKLFDLKQSDVKQSVSKQLEMKPSENKQIDIKHSDIKLSDLKQIDSVKQIDSKPIEEVKEYKDFKEIIETFQIKEDGKDTKDSKLASLKNSRNKLFPKALFYPSQSKLEVDVDDTMNDMDRIKAEVFKEVENAPDTESVQDEVFMDSEQDMVTSLQIGMPSLPTTIEDAIHKEVIELCKPTEMMDNFMD